MQTKRAFGAGLNPAWAKWAHQHRQAISDGFEYDFVVRVLSKIPIIMPEEVIPQYRFKDHTGRERRIDFVIQNHARGLFLALELDGARRGEDELQAQWADFLQRQNDLLELVGPLLRFSNSQMFKNSSAIVERITQTLNTQATRHKERLLLQREEASLKSKMRKIEQEMAELQRAANSGAEEGKPEEYEATLQKLQEAHKAAEEQEQALERSITEARLAQLTAAQNSTLNALEESKNGQKQLRTLLIFAAIILLFMGGILYNSMSKTSPKAQAPINSLNLPKGEEMDTDAARVAHMVAVQKFLSDNEGTIIAARGVSDHVGEVVTACGVISGYKAFAKGVYLNIDKPFPHQSVSFVLWDRNLREIEHKVGRVATLVGRDSCAKGEVESYRGRYQISIRSAEDIIVD